MSLWWRIGGGAFLAMNGMVFSMALNGSDVTAEERYALELTSCFIALPVFVLLSKEFIEASWRSLCRRQLSIELLFLIGIVSSITASVLYFVRGTGNGYADVAAMLLVIYALGRQIGAYGKHRVLDSLRDWAPEKRMARRVNGEMVTAADVQPGDQIRILPGESVPVDCRVIAGSAFVQEASLTGESLAVSKTTGDHLLAGSFPLDGSLDGFAVAGAGGRMGRTLIDGVIASQDLALVAALDVAGSPLIGQPAAPGSDVRIGDSLDVIGDADVLIDFTRPAGSMAHLAKCVQLGRAIVIGTTGFSDAEKATIEQAATRIPIVFSPNMSVGVKIGRAHV